MRTNHFAELSAFAAVAEHRNFTRAAAHLRLAPSTLSQTVRALEERLGVRLLNRTTRSVALTDAGERLLAHVRPVLDGLDRTAEAISVFRDTPMGHLRLTASRFASVAILAPLLRDFLRAFPDISVEVFVDDSHSDIIDGHFDAGVRWGKRIEKDMIAIHLGNHRLILVASPAYLAGKPCPVTPADLHGHRCIPYRHTWDGAIRRWVLAKDGEQAEVTAEGTLIVNDMDLAIEAAIDGLGVAYVPQAMAAAAIADGRLVPLLSDWCSAAFDFFLYYSSRHQVPLTLRTLVEFVRRRAHGAGGAETTDGRRSQAPVPVAG
jgi:DNA-binding transcriptional LysR family regulator